MSNNQFNPDHLGSPDVIRLITSSSWWEFKMLPDSKFVPMQQKVPIFRDKVEIYPEVTGMISGFEVTTNSLSFPEAVEPQYCMGRLYLPIVLKVACFFDIVGHYAGRNTGWVRAIYLNGELMASVEA